MHTDEKTHLFYVHLLKLVLFQSKAITLFQLDSFCLFSQIVWELLKTFSDGHWWICILHILYMAAFFPPSSPNRGFILLWMKYECKNISYMHICKVYYLGIMKMEITLVSYAIIEVHNTIISEKVFCIKYCCVQTNCSRIDWLYSLIFA